jgi:hypothetical protein
VDGSEPHNWVCDGAMNFGDAITCDGCVLVVFFYFYVRSRRRSLCGGCVSCLCLSPSTKRVHGRHNWVCDGAMNFGDAITCDGWVNACGVCVVSVWWLCGGRFLLLLGFKKNSRVCDGDMNFGDTITCGGWVVVGPFV